MSLPVFVADLSVVEPGDQVRVIGAEAHHAATVRRLQAGDQVVLTDTNGGRATGSVLHSDREEMLVQVQHLAREPAPTPLLTVVQALPKGERGELAVQMLTEVGVDRIVPWQAQRSVAVWRGDRARRSTAKWQRTAYESSKQARRTHFAQVADLHQTRDLLGVLELADLVVVLHEDATQPLADLDPARADRIAIVVGPEGGISDTEIEQLGSQHCYRLGAEVLRTSTAGVVAAAALLSRTSRWGAPGNAPTQ